MVCNGAGRARISSRTSYIVFTAAIVSNERFCSSPTFSSSLMKSSADTIYLARSATAFKDLSGRIVSGDTHGIRWLMQNPRCINLKFLFMSTMYRGVISSVRTLSLGVVKVGRGHFVASEDARLFKMLISAGILNVLCFPKSGPNLAAHESQHQDRCDPSKLTGSVKNAPKTRWRHPWVRMNQIKGGSSLVLLGAGPWPDRDDPSQALCSNSRREPMAR